MYRKQSGFTLVEIAIVLVIIGLLLGGVLKGQELINSAKVKNLASDFRNVPIFVYGYQDKYRAVPGDDGQVNAHISQVCGATGTLGVTCVPANGTHNNSVIEGFWNDGVAADTEAVRFWQHVRAANLAAGAAAIADVNLPTNSDGGRIGIESVNQPTAGFTPVITGITGSYAVCTDGVAGRFVRQLDTTMDDGCPATGSIRAVPTGSARNTAGVGIQNNANCAAAATLNDDSQYVVCMTF